MNRFLKPTWRLVLSAFVLSAVIHVCVLGGFIFEFPLMRTAFKPEFTFWGSVLKSRDVYANGAGEEMGEYLPNQTDVMGTNMQGYVYQNQEIRQSPFGAVSDEKPSFQTAAEAKKKITMKSIFKIPSPKTISSDEERKTDLKEHVVPPYQPLRLLPR